MLSNLSNNNAGNQTKSVVERKHYEQIESRLDELQGEIDTNSSAIAQNASNIETLDDRIGAVEDNSTFPTLNTDTLNPATGDKIDVTGNLDVDGNITADTANFGELSVNGTNFTTVKDDAAQAKSTAESAKNKAGEAYELADAVADELANYKADNEQSITTGTLDAGSVITDSIAAQTINTNDFETTNAEIDKLYVDTIKATGFLELPTAGQSYYTITVPAKTTASFSGDYTSSNNTDYPFYFTVSDGAVIYKQGSTEIIKDISFDRETGNTKVRFKSSTNLTYISTALDSNPVTIEDGGNAYTDYVFIPQKTVGYLVRGYDDTTTEIYIAGVLRAYAMSIEEEIIERTSVDFLKVNASIELPEDWDAGGTISYSTGEENQYISAQTKSGVTKPTWTSSIHSTIGSLSYSSKLVDEATVASYKGIAETRQTETISITGEASLQQLTAFHWTKNGNYWQPYELTRITIGDNTMWIDPTEANQGIRFIDNQVIADGTWNDVPVEEANAVPVNLVIFDAPTELSFPITNLGDKSTVHGEITATCFKGNVLGNVTGNADTATNATCFSNKTYAEAKADILSGCAADSNMFNGKTYSEACADILSGNAATATNATCFDNKTYAEAKADILSGCAANANDATCFDGKTYSEAKTDILSGCASAADNATCFNGKTYSEAKTDILTGTAAQAHCVDIDSLTTNSYPLVMESATCELGKSGTCPITFTPSTGILETNQVSTSCIENSGTTKSQYLCATCDLNVDGNAYITGDLTVQGTITTTHSEEVVTPSENIILRDGATTPIASGCYSGFTVTNYDGQNNNLEVGVDNEGTLKIGTSSANMEAVATRTCSACMESCYVAKWDATDKQVETKGTSCTHDLCINGDATATGTITGTFSGNLTGNADTATNSTCFNGKTYSEAKTDILSGNAASATNATCFNGKTYACAKADILSGCAADSNKFNGKTYSQAKADILSGCAADSAKLGNKLPSCYIDTSSTAQTKAGNLCIGAPAACTSTSAGGQGTFISSVGVIDLYRDSCPYVDFHYQKYCGDFSSRIANLYATNSCNGILRMTVNNGKGCTASDTTANFDFYSDGTFTGASTICASTNIYSNGCPVVTTGTLPTVAPGYNCTGTSNYVVTTMVCCARAVRRNQASTGTCHLAMFADNSDASNANMYVSSACELTYEPATGVLTTCTVCAKNTNPVRTIGYSAAHDAYSLIASTKVSSGIVGYTSMELILFSVNSVGSYPVGHIFIDFSSGVSSNAWNIQGFTDINIYDSRNASYPRIVVSKDTENYNIYVQSIYTYERLKVEYKLSYNSTIPDTITNTDSPSGTIVFDSSTDKTKIVYVKNVPSAMSVDVSTSSSNAEYPLVFSTCCATPSAGNRTLYNDSSNNLMYNPSSNMLITSCIRGNTMLVAGTPTLCTSTVAGKSGIQINSNGSMALYSNTNPMLAFRNNNANSITSCLVANNCYLRLTSTNATGCCAATQTANFDFCSDGTLKATCFDGTINMNCVADAASTNVAANSITRKTILRNQITNVGYITSAAIGLCRGTSGFGQAVLSVSCNDAGSVWKDYCFNTTGRISANGLTLHNNGGINTGVSLKVGTASSNADRNIMFTPAVPGSDNTSTGEVQVSSCCPLTYNPSTGVLTATCFIAGSCPVALICDIPATPTCVACAECVDLECWRDCDLYLVGTPHLGATQSYSGPRRLVATHKPNISCLYYCMNSKNLYASGDKFTKDCQFVLSGCTLTITM